MAYDWSSTIKQSKIYAPFIDLIHVDSEKLLKEIDKNLQNNRIIDCLLQIHIATENTKFGLSQMNQMKFS